MGAPCSVAGVVLAGGRARRLGGGDKPLRVVAGRTLLDRVLERLRPQVAAVALNANGDPARFAAFGLPVVPDPLPDHPGPLAGLLAGMMWARACDPPFKDVLTVAGDTPFLPRDLAARLAASRAASGAAIAVAASGGRVHPVVALCPVCLAPDLTAALHGGERRVTDWIARHGAAVACFSTERGDPFFNVNRAEDLAEAERIAAEE